MYGTIIQGINGIQRSKLNVNAGTKANLEA